MPNQIIAIGKKGSIGTFFTITSKKGRDVTDEEIISGVTSFFSRLYKDFNVSLIVDVGEFTDILVSGPEINIVLSWSFVTNIEI
jgi:hypothetical protein